MTTVSAAAPMLIERLLPRYDAVRIEHRVVPGDVEAAYGAVMRADFMRAWRESAGVRVCGSCSQRARSESGPLRQRRAGRSWSLRCRSRCAWRTLACNFSMRAYGAAQTLVSYECRTLATDEIARAGCLRYWRPLSPFIGVVLRAQLGVVADEAARARL
jgi:hypothetical protein